MSRASGSRPSTTASIRDTEQLDYDAIRALAEQHRPRLIICGSSAYPRTIDFEAFRCDRR